MLASSGENGAETSSPACVWLSGPNGGGRRSDSVEDFYRGKVLSLFVGYGPGGGYDVMGRLLARHMGKHIPGNPTIVVQNMPGAGTLLRPIIFTIALLRTAPSSASLPATCHCSALVGSNPNVRFDPRKFTWIGSSSDFSDDAYVLIVRKDSPVKSIADARRADGPPLFSAERPRAPAAPTCPKILRDALGIHMKLILGYRDSAAIFLAMENAEIDRAHGGDCRRCARPVRNGSTRKRLSLAVDVRARANAIRSFPTCRRRGSLRPTPRRAS